MITICNIAEALAKMLKAEIMRCDYQYNIIKHAFIAHLDLGSNDDDIVKYEFEIHENGRFIQL